MALSASERDHFIEQGYLRLDDCIDRATADR
ncbi:uncharacterized protein METZ01_LOCUS281926 [marine metagenome]|uniref:Uncharacterized protein n=1 Tax=marine metagenome TaxID=408172 RepID=A0A382L171_9ZZZZ